MRPVASSPRVDLVVQRSPGAGPVPPRLGALARTLGQALAERGLVPRLWEDWPEVEPATGTPQAVVILGPGTSRGVAGGPTVRYPLAPRDTGRALAEAVARRLRAATGDPWPLGLSWGALSVARGTPLPAVAVWVGEGDLLDRAGLAIAAAIADGIAAWTAGCGPQGTDAAPAVQAPEPREPEPSGPPAEPVPTAREPEVPTEATAEPSAPSPEPLPATAPVPEAALVAAEADVAPEPEPSGPPPEPVPTAREPEVPAETEATAEPSAPSPEPLPATAPVPEAALVAAETDVAPEPEPSLATDRAEARDGESGPGEVPPPPPGAEPRVPREATRVVIWAHVPEGLRVQEPEGPGPTGPCPCPEAS
jgi:hypothetical protein